MCIRGRKGYMRKGDDNLVEMGCCVSCSVYFPVDQLCVSPHLRTHLLFFFFFVCFTYRRRIAERRQLEHGFDEGARAPHCADFIILCYWCRMSCRADG